MPLTAARRVAALCSFGLLLGLLFLGGCEVPVTQLVVAVTTDFTSDELRSVELRVARGPVSGDSRLVQVTPNGRGGVEPLSFTIAPREGSPLASQRIGVEVVGRIGTDRESCVLATRSVETGFVEGRTLRVPIALHRGCLPGCDDGFVDPAELEEVVPGHEFDGIDAGARAGGLPVSCVDASLTDGGLRDSGLLDAGPPDGGPPDAGALPTGIEIEQLAVGGGHACVLLAEEAGGSRLWCWGDSRSGQIVAAGSGATYSVPRPIELRPAGEVARAPRRLALGGAYSCALDEFNQLVCWGLDPRTTPPTQIMQSYFATRAAELAAARNHLCFVSSADGFVRCIGANSICQCGNCATFPVGVEQCYLDYCNAARQNLPAGDPEAAAVMASSLNSCALSGLGRLYCWGANSSGELGLGAPVVMSTVVTQTWRPVVIQEAAGVPLEGVESVAMGLGFACARQTGGALLCWGRNGRGQLGRGTTTTGPNPEPVAVPGPSGGYLAASAGWEHVCAIGADGYAYCWGRNTVGELGFDAIATDIASPTRVELEPDEPLEELAVGAQFSCARSRRKIWCWGRNDQGQLGDGTNTSHFLPTPVLTPWNDVGG